MATTTARILLRPEASRSVFDERAAALGWALAADEARAHGRPARRVYRPAPDSEVGWIEDHGLGVAYVAVTGAPELERELSALLPHFTRAELLAEVKAAGMKNPRAALSALRMLTALEAWALSPELRDLVVRWMGHDNQIVRRAVLHLCWAGAWKELLPEIERRSEADEDLADGWERLAEALRD
ncbi:MAG: hypothetical protein IT372_15820 [Polyangiaceae bacterium]|nr:hypothetical protein [Polyangiaceae bacterium]